MNPFEMVIWIVVIVTVAGIIKSFINRGKPDMPEDVMDNMLHNLGMDDYYSKKKIDPYLQRIDKMEERIRILERIATDKSRNLADEINRL